MRIILFIFALFSLLACQPDVLVDPDPFGESDRKVVVDKEGIEYQLTRELPEQSETRGDVLFYDFGRAAFSQPMITVTGHAKDTLFFSIGECVKDGRVDANPGQFRRYRRLAIVLQEGKHTYQPVLERDPYGSVISGFSMPDVVGEVTPFRYLELEQPTKYPDCSVSRISVTCPFNDDASFFESDDPILNQVWDFCKYSIKATSFTGYYIDGDRERKPYEADALINQLGHYAVDFYYPVARRTCEYLLKNPTWPTEWILQTVMIAWNDYLFTGSKEIISQHYDLLKLHALFELVDSRNGLLTTKHGQSSSLLSSLGLKTEMVDIVDWPHTGEDDPGEDDGFSYTDYNAVVNAFHYKTVETLSEIAFALGKNQEGEEFQAYAKAFIDIFNKTFFDPERGVYVDGLGDTHASLHANMFPLAFGMVPDKQKDRVADFVCSRGMACSVYGAQYLLEALYAAGRADVALGYLRSDGGRSWYNMMREGSTIAMEAWGNKFKPDQDWNHAWGAAPANIIPFRLLGIQPLEPAFNIVEIRPQLSKLNTASVVVPTIKGRISVQMTHTKLAVTLPDNVFARVIMPVPFPHYRVLVNGRKVQTRETGGYIELVDLLKGASSVLIVEE